MSITIIYQKCTGVKIEKLSFYPGEKIPTFPPPLCVLPPVKTLFLSPSPGVYYRELTVPF